MLNITIPQVEKVFTEKLIESLNKIKAGHPKKFNYGKAYTLEEHGKTNSHYFSCTGSGLYHYELKPNVSATDALLDLIDNQKTTMLFACQAAFSIALYAAIYQTLKHFHGEEKAKNIFDQFFNNNLTIVEFDIFCGSSVNFNSLSYVAQHGLIYQRLHPLYFFIEYSDAVTTSPNFMTALESILPGDFTFFINHPNYIKKHHTGLARRDMVVCSSNDGVAKFNGYGLRCNDLTAEQIREYHLQEYNKPGLLQHQAAIEEIPGFSPDFLRRLNPVVLHKMVTNPNDLHAEFVSFAKAESSFVGACINVYQTGINSLQGNRTYSKTLTHAINLLEKSAESAYKNNDLESSKENWLQALAHLIFYCCFDENKNNFALQFKLALMEGKIAQCYEKLNDNGNAYKFYYRALSLCHLIKLNYNPSNCTTNLIKELQDSLQRIGYPVYVNPHAALMREIKASINKDDEAYLKLFLGSLKAKNYNQALRRLATSNKPSHDCFIDIIMKYKDVLKIDINEAAGDLEETALHQAAKRGSKEIYEKLVAHGANPELENSNGESAKLLLEKFTSGLKLK